MFRCIRKCGRSFAGTTYFADPPEACPRCGGKIIKEKTCKDANIPDSINFHNRWNAKHMQVGIDKVYCPTRQSYMDACKHGRVIEAGTRKISTVVIDPVGAKD